MHYNIYFNTFKIKIQKYKISRKTQETKKQLGFANQKNQNNSN